MKCHCSNVKYESYKMTQTIKPSTNWLILSLNIWIEYLDHIKYVRILQTTNCTNWQNSVKYIFVKRMKTFSSGPQTENQVHQSFKCYSMDVTL